MWLAVKHGTCHARIRTHTYLRGRSSTFVDSRARCASARERQREPEPRALAELAVDPDVAPVGGDDAPGDRQAEPRAAFARAPRPVPVEHVRELARRDARTAIADREHGLALDLLERQLDRRALGVLERVADQVAKHLE